MKITTRFCEKKIKWTEVISVIVLTIFVAIIVIPFWNAVVISLQTPASYIKNPISLWPKEFTLENYKYIFDQDGGIWVAYGGSIVCSIVGTLLGMSISTLAAYVFSRRFPGKKILFLLMVFSMYFSGGLIPAYLLLKNLHLTNTYFGCIFLSLVSCYNIIIMKGGFESIPVDLQHAAQIDGANDLQLFVRIMLPLQKPMIATFSLFAIVGFWNNWYWPMLILTDNKKSVLQLFLKSIIDNITMAQASSTSLNLASAYTETFSPGVKMASVFVVILPIMVVYPFLQKYFTSGIMVGAIKM